MRSRRIVWTTLMTSFLVGPVAAVAPNGDSRDGGAKRQFKTENGRASSRPAFEPRRVAREFPALVDSPVIAADKVTDQVTEKELVLGVVVEGEARAYPINMLTGPKREIINDTLGGRAIAATW